MSLLEKLKTSALQMSIKHKLYDVTQNIVKANPELITEDLTLSAISTGDYKTIRAFCDHIKITPDNGNKYLEALSKIPEETGNYGETAAHLIGRDLMKNVNFSDFLKTHCEKVQNLEQDHRVHPLKHANLRSKNGHGINHKDVLKAITENIASIDHDTAMTLLKQNYIKPEQQYQKSEVLFTSENLTVGLYTIAANANNIQFVKALERANFPYNVHDMVAVKDLAARAGNMYDIQKASEQSDDETVGMNLKEVSLKVPKRLIATFNAPSVAERFKDLVNDVKRGAGHIYDAPLPANTAMHNLPSESIAVIAYVADTVANNQYKNASPEMQKQYEELLLNRERVLKSENNFDRNRTRPQTEYTDSGLKIKP